MPDLTLVADPPCHCSLQLGTCPTAQACERPVGAVPRLAKTFRPDFGITGPSRHMRRRPRSRFPLAIALVLSAVLLAAHFLVRFH